MIHIRRRCPECEQKNCFQYERGPIREIRCMDCDYHEFFNIGWKYQP